MNSRTPPKPPATSPVTTVEMTCSSPNTISSFSPRTRELRKFGRPLNGTA